MLWYRDNFTLEQVHVSGYVLEGKDLLFIPHQVT